MPPAVILICVFTIAFLLGFLLALILPQPSVEDILGAEETKTCDVCPTPPRPTEIVYKDSSDAKA